MSLRRDVIDLVAEIGKVTSIDAAMDVFKSKMDDTQFSRIQQIKNENALLKIANAIKTVSYTHLTLPTTPYV